MFFKISALTLLSVAILSTSFCVSKDKYLARLPDGDQEYEVVESDEKTYKNSYGALVVVTEVRVSGDSSKTFLDIFADCGEGVRHNLFQEPYEIKKIAGPARKVSKSTFKVLYVEGWQSVLNSNQVQVLEKKPTGIEFDLKKICLSHKK